MIIDVMWGKMIANKGPNGAGPTGNSFTVNNAVNEVVLSGGGLGTGAHIYGVPNYDGSVSFAKIQAKDSITILSLGLMVPYSFVQSAMASLSFGYWATDGIGPALFNPIPEINIPTGDVPIPFYNYEMSIGTYVPWPVPASGNPGGNYAYYYLCSFFPPIATAKVSMIGAPASLNGVVITPVPFVKIQHTLPLLAI
jgi:hypothetical protein